MPKVKLRPRTTSAVVMLVVLLDQTRRKNDVH